MTVTANALGERAMLVGLSISIWSARKQDLTISDQVAAQHGADRSLGRYSKHLIPRARLARVTGAANALREHHNLNTLAWGDDGTRILLAANYLPYQEQQLKLEDEFHRAVGSFVINYPSYVAEARQALNGLFNVEDYPASFEIEEKFGVRRAFLPVAQAGDFRVQLGDAQVAQIRAEIEQRNVELVADATRELWQRVHEVTAKLVDKLSAFQVEPDGTRLHPFRDSLIDNVRSLLDLLPRLNLTGDPAIEHVRQQLADEVACHDPETLRQDRALRACVIDAAGDILSQMEGYC